MKKFLAFVLIAVSILALSACKYDSVSDILESDEFKKGTQKAVDDINSFWE